MYALTALMAALALAKVVMWFCRRVNWVDKPDARKKHSGAVPLSGGLLVLLSIGLTGLLLQPTGFDLGLLFAALAIFAIGFYDDRFPLRARYRFFCHLAAAALLIFANDTIVHSLGQTFGPTSVSLGLLAIPFTLIAIPGLINAFNMVDGADGLSGGQILVSLFWLIFVACLVPIEGTDQFAIRDLGPTLFPTAGALLGFLFFNMRAPWRKRAAMFLGDGGSMMLGLIIAWAIIHLSNNYGAGGLSAASALWIVAVPLFDLFSAIIRRVADGRTPMSPDRKHMHHLLIQRGMSVSGAVTTMNLAAFVFAAVGVLSWMAQVPGFYLFWSLVFFFCLYMVYAHRFWQTHDQVSAHRRDLFKTAHSGM